MRRFKSILKIALPVLLVAWIGFLIAVGWAMRQPPEVFGRFMSKLPLPAYFVIPFETMWSQARGGSLEVGESAPDFTLPLHDKSGYIRLSSLRGWKPVVLVFGSYT
jgi:hypothetical protein